LPTGVDVSYQAISPDGKTLLMMAAAAGRQNLYLYSLDDLAKEPAVAKQITSTPGFKNHAQFSPDGKTVFYLEQGRIHEVSVDGKESKQIAVTAEMDVDFAREKVEAFREAWSYLNDNFFDGKFNGVNWRNVESEYAPLIEGSRTPDEMRALLELMVGELNASHLGVSAPPGGPQPEVGKLGLSFDTAEYESNGRLRITEVVPLGPAALAGNVKIGDYLLSVDGMAIDSHMNLDQLLEHKIGKKVTLSVASAADGAGKHDAELRPVNQFTEKQLLYEKWVQDNRAYVAKVSAGRLGYVHMEDMGMGSLEGLFMNLDEENMGRDGVVVDVRNNTGGFVNAYAIDVLARRPYLTMSVRGLPSAPARSVLGQRALERPTVLVTNRHSLSDAEDFTEGYRTLKLGTVVGEPTSGWIIYTGGVSLIDGTNLRIPFMKVTSHDGTPMELHPRPVDVEVTRPIGESFTGRDSQLDTAVRELLKEVGEERTAAQGQK
jgi:tricorn protease